MLCSPAEKNPAFFEIYLFFFKKALTSLSKEVYNVGNLIYMEGVDKNEQQ